MMRLVCTVVCLAGLGAACTEEAEFVPAPSPDAATSGATAMGGGGPGMPPRPMGGSYADIDPQSIPAEQVPPVEGGKPECAMTDSGNADCTTCLETNCADHWDACNSDGDRCGCGQWGDVIGQSSCMLQCEEFRPRGPDYDRCAEACGGLDALSERTVALISCGDNFGTRPPTCGDCFAAPPGP